MTLTKATSWMVAVLALCGCLQQRNAPKGSVYEIIDDGGGQILAAEADRARLAAWGGPVEIGGYCNSACVIFTTLPNACLQPDAVIGFHAANLNLGPVGNAQITRYLRAGVRQRWLSDWQFVPNDDIHHITARRYVRLDPQARLCDA